MQLEERTFSLDEAVSGVDMYGERDSLLRVLEERFDARIVARGHELRLFGESRQADLIARVLDEMQAMVKRGHHLRVDDVEQIVRMVREDSGVVPSQALSESIRVSPQKPVVRAKNAAQQAYIRAIQGHDIVFSIGPAGTGKTYLAMAMGISALERGQVKRIILTRPVVEAGEKLGYLPGDMNEKISPYIRPLTDALHDMMDFEKIQRLMGYGVIEIAPLAYMRGRTLNQCFVVLDEAQNSTSNQMKMFLTRLGYDSKAVVTGDITQVDLEKGQKSGLIDARDVLREVPGIFFMRFDSRDVVRHPLVQRIVDAYEANDARRDSSAEEPS